MMKKPTMQAGGLDRRILIEENSGAAPNAIGEVVETWTTVDIVWAGFRPGSGREFMSAGGGERVAEASAVFLIRYRSDITPQMRVTHDAKVYNITAVSEYGRRVGLELMAVEHRA